MASEQMGQTLDQFQPASPQTPPPPHLSRPMPAARRSPCAAGGRGLFSGRVGRLASSRKLLKKSTSCLTAVTLSPCLFRMCLRTNSGACATKMLQLFLGQVIYVHTYTCMHTHAVRPDLELLATQRAEPFVFTELLGVGRQELLHLWTRAEQA